MATGYQIIDSIDGCEDDNLTYDWETCETLQTVKAFPISDYRTKSDDQSSTDDFLVPEPSLSGIIDSTIRIPKPRTLSDVEEKFIDDYMSSLTNDTDIKVSDAPRKHEFAKERVEREGIICDKLYNAALKGELSFVKDILENHNTVLLPDENGQTSLYAACIRNHLEIINLLVDFGYDVNHQDNDGKTVLHIAFENHIRDLAQILITQFSAKIEIRDTQNWTPLHTAIDRGYFSYSKELSEKFLHQDVGTEVSWIQLHAACFQDNSQDVQFLLDASTDANHDSSAGYTPLHIAVTKGSIDIVTRLLDQEVNINSVTIDGKTPLHIAVEKDHEVIIQKLLEKNADPRLKDAPGNTSLHLAVRMKQKTRSEHVKAGASYTSPFPTAYHTCSIQTVRAIIDHGADVNAVNNRGQTSLWLACVDGQDSFVKILLNTEGDPSTADKDGDSCLHAAVHGQCSSETIQEILDHGAHINAVNKDGATPLLLACSTANEEAMKLLLKAKANPKIAYADGDTSLHQAIAAFCSKEAIQEIIDHGVEVNTVNKRGRTALLLGCFYRQMDSVKVLLEAGANPSVADEEGFSCLHAAIDGYCSKDTVQALIDHGAHIDATRKDGTNALLRACTTGQSDSVMFLLEAKADTNIAKPNGNTCLHEAINGHCNGEALQKIVQQGVSVNYVNNKSETALLHACYTAQAESVKLLLENRADPNISDAYSHTCLHAAVHGCCPNETLQEIIIHEVQLDAQNTNGKTALWLACQYRQQEHITILLRKGSNPNFVDNNGFTCLHAALIGCCSKTIVSTLLDHGAHVNVTSKFNVTALILACQKRNKNIVNILLNAGADPNTADDKGATCIYYAIREGCSKDELETIVIYGADVNVTNKNNVTVLMIACEKGNKDAINVLLNAGADPNIADSKGATCIYYAIREGCSKDVLETIVNHGTDVNVTNKYNVTALMLVCEKGNKDAINVLLNAGADPNITDTDGYACLHYAAQQDCCTDVLRR